MSDPMRVFGATIIVGGCVEKMRTLPDRSVHTCVTSPPYFGLRDYGHEGQIGLEDTPDAYVARLVEVFSEVRRVLRDDGTLWLNLGDSYNSGSNYSPDAPSNANGGSQARNAGAKTAAYPKKIDGLKHKDLIGIPWRVAFALQADGWYLRQDIIWHKPNPMPESVRDRCTKAHEYLFLLSKGPKYYFDAEAIAQPLATTSVARLSQPTLAKQAGSDRVPGKTNGAMKAVGPRFGGSKYGDDDSDHARTKSGNEWNGGAGKANRRSVRRGIIKRSQRAALQTVLRTPHGDSMGCRSVCKLKTPSTDPPDRSPRPPARRRSASGRAARQRTPRAASGSPRPALPRARGSGPPRPPARPETGRTTGQGRRRRTACSRTAPRPQRRAASSRGS